MAAVGSRAPGPREQASMRSLVHELVGSVLSDVADDDNAEECADAFQEVFGKLSSATTLRRTVVGEEEAYLGDRISEHLLRNGQRDARGIDAHLRFQGLYRQLQKSSSLRPDVRCGMIRMLHRLGVPASGESTNLGSFSRRPPGMSSARDGLQSRISEPPLWPPGSRTSSAPTPSQSSATGPRTTAPSMGHHVGASGAPPTDLSEAQLLRDMLHALQGVDSAVFKFRGTDGMRALQVNPSYVLTRPARLLSQKIMELGNLHVRLCTATNSVLEAESGTSLLHQALMEALRDQLRDYYKVLALLMSKAADGQTAASSNGPGEDGAAPLTLRRLWAWLQEPLERMRLLVSLCEACLPLRGGALASTVYGFSCVGDSIARDACVSMLRRVVVPLLSMIRAWMTEGELRDPFGEFFVCADSGVPLEELWQRSYFLEIEMVPCFVTLELARKILLTGKSVNFIRLSCPGQEWLPQTSAGNPLAHPADLQSSADFPGDDDDLSAPPRPGAKAIMPLADLADRVGKAALLTNRHLVSLMMNQYSLGEHCLALRRFMLLGQGDFVESLMDAAEVELSKDASQLYRHQLIGVLDSAVRQSNAQFCHPDTIARLSVKLLSASDGEKGWDVFLLDYAISSPLHVVFSPSVMQQYDRAFLFLWKLRRVSHALNSCWSAHMTLQRHLVSCGRLMAYRAPDFDMELRQTLHKCGCLRNEMHHFVQNIHSYVMCGVLDSSWAKLQAGWKSCTDLDQVIAEHQRYLACIEDGAFLSPGTQQVLSCLTLLFSHALEFTELHDQVCANAFEAADTIGGPDPPDGPLPATRSLAECRAELDKVGSSFLVRLQSLLRTLEGSHSLQQLETDVRFLLCRLDFNSYYKQKTTAPWSDRVRPG